MNKLKLAWKHRRRAWQFRKLLRHRREILIGATALGIVAVAAVARRATTARPAASKG